MSIALVEVSAMSSLLQQPKFIALIYGAGRAELPLKRPLH